MSSAEETHSDTSTDEIELQSINTSRSDHGYVRMDPNGVDFIHHQLSASLDEKQKESLESPLNVPTTTISAIVNTRAISIDDYKINTNHKETLQKVDDKHLVQFKFKKLFKTGEFLGRFLILILSILCLALSTAYCVGQSYYSQLDIVKHCAPKSIEDIWEHSYNGGLKPNGSVEMNVTSQWGITDDVCWTTKRRETNTDQLWYSNVKEAQFVLVINIESVLFGMIAICFFCIICYNIYTLCKDIISVSRDELYKTSKMYSYFIEHELQQKQTTKPPTIESWLQRRIRDLNIIWVKYMTSDTTGWIIRSVISEILELVVQTQALLLYNGYNIFDVGDIYLANKAHFIALFAAILSFNCFGSGVLWLSYALLTKCCHGLLFKLLLFFVDQLSDLLYSIFPFFLIIWDDYNANSGDIKVLLAELKTDSLIAFVSTFLPLSLLCFKSLNIIRSAKNQLADRYYKHWKFIFDVTKQKNDEQLMYQAKINMYNVDRNINNKELYDHRGYFAASLNATREDKNWIYSDKGHKISCKKQCILVCIAFVYIIYGFGILYFVITHLNNAESYCSMIKESNYFVNGEFDINRTMLNNEQCKLLHSNPELYHWDKCLYKVYPFVSNHKDSLYHQPCQCRVLVIQWNNSNYSQSTANLYFGLNRTTILTAMLEHFFMLEKFQTVGYENYAVATKIKSSMFVAKHMKAFEWRDAQIGMFERGIYAWQQLEYLKFEESNMLYGIPNDSFDGLKSMKYLSFDGTQLQEFPYSICSLKQLTVLYIHVELLIKSIPNCIANLTQLEELIIDNCITLEYVPLAIFSLPNLETLSLFHGKISLESLVHYNAPNDIDKNDTSAVRTWLNHDFIINPMISEYYLSLNPICKDNSIESWFSSDVYGAIKAACSYGCDISDNDEETGESFCPPRLLQNGKCDVICNNGDCMSDYGDCVQLCFSPELTNCNYTKYTNNVCDEGCDNEYCAEYSDELFQYRVKKHLNSPDLFTGTDNWDCTQLIHTSENDSCWESNSTYFSDEYKKKIHLYTKCDLEWLSNGECDDLCRTDECMQDGGDCLRDTCIDNVCEFIYEAWLWLVGPFICNVNISYFCNTLYPIAKIALDGDPLQGISCEGQPYIYDFNDDGFVNFREFTFLAFWFGGGWTQRGKQLNCSECTGMKCYNADNNDVGELNTTIYIDYNPDLDRCNSKY